MARGSREPAKPSLKTEAHADDGAEGGERDRGQAGRQDGLSDGPDQAGLEKQSLARLVPDFGPLAGNILPEASDRSISGPRITGQAVRRTGEDSSGNAETGILALAGCPDMAEIRAAVAGTDIVLPNRL